MCTNKGQVPTPCHIKKSELQNHTLNILSLTVTPIRAQRRFVPGHLREVRKDALQTVKAGPGAWERGAQSPFHFLLYSLFRHWNSFASTILLTIE